MFSPPAILTSRQQEILLGILTSFVESNEPVGSKTLAHKYVRNLSPASIRYELSELTDQGYLHQPHTSSGRVPTDRAYRFYVDQLTDLPPLTEMEVERIHIDYDKAPAVGLESLLEQTSKLLSSLTHHASVVLLPSLSRTVFRQIRIARLRPHVSQITLVAQNGIIRNRLIELEEDLPQNFLDKVERFLSDEFEGMTLQEVRSRIEQQVFEHKRDFDVLYGESLKMCEKAFLETAVEGDEFIAYGTNHILDDPEFQADFEKMRALFVAFQEKSKIIAILDKCAHDDGVSVSIGSETEVEEMKDFTIIAKRYGDGSQGLGTVGIIGPKRMHYPRIMALVDIMAAKLSQRIASDPNL